MVIDAFPFFNELDVLEVRLNELAPYVDKFVIVECKETYGGQPKPMYLGDNWDRFKPFHGKILHGVIDKLHPPQRYRLQQNVSGVSATDIRTTGRNREANQRVQMLSFIMGLNPAPSDILSFGDCDEIPRGVELHRHLSEVLSHGIHRFKQRTYYYNVNCMIDYGRDVCSRARIGRFSDLTDFCNNNLYDFRMFGNKGKPYEVPAIEEGGWHFSYFGGDLAKLHEKVSALNPFLSEYKLFGDTQLVRDIQERKDLHHRPTAFSELPAVFEARPTDDYLLPQYFLDNQKKFELFTQQYFVNKYRG